MQGDQTGSLSSPSWWELLCHGGGVCSAHQGIALNLLGSVAPVVNYWAFSGWKLPWRREVAAGACGVSGQCGGWEHGCVGLAWKRKGNPLMLPSSLPFLFGMAWDSFWPFLWNVGKRRSKEDEVDLNSFLPSFLTNLAVSPVTCLINSFPCIEITPFRRIRVIWSAVINPSSFDAKLRGPSWELGWQVGKCKWEHRCPNRILWL